MNFLIEKGHQALNYLEENMIFVIAIGFVLIILLNFLTKKKKEKGSHKWRRKSANKAFLKVKSFEHPGQVFGYLRKVDPFVVEEIILNAIDQKMDVAEVIRNDRYTGDGGIDGRFVYYPNSNKANKQLGIVQVKRYQSYINNKDVEIFEKQIEEENAGIGLFVHTGKTGKASYRKNSKVIILSGQKLIDLIKSKGALFS